MFFAQAAGAQIDADDVKVVQMEMQQAAVDETSSQVAAHEDRSSC